MHARQRLHLLSSTLLTPSCAEHWDLSRIDDDKRPLRPLPYYEYSWVRHRDHIGDKFIRELPSQLRSRVSYIVHAPSIQSCPLFSKLHRKVVAALASTLQPQVFLPAEYILIAGHVSRCMYFVARGRVSLMHFASTVGDAGGFLAALRPT